jgi:hypothetical protein
MKFSYNYKFCFLFLVVYLSSILAFKLSSNNYFPLAHGPYYFSFAESLYNNLGVYSFWTIPQDPKLVYTFQMGVSFIMYLCLLIFNLKFWYFAFYFFSSYLWILAFIQLEKFLKSISFKKNEILFLIFIIFFQPYNINQIATFSNETIYLPTLILSFFIFINLVNNFEKNFSLYVYILIFSFFLFGIFLRVHHLAFIGSIGLYILFFKKNLIKYFILLFSISILIFICAIYFTPLANSLGMAKSILLTSLDNFNISFIYNKIFSISNSKSEMGMGYIYYNQLFLPTLERLANIFTYPILLSKFTNSILIKSFFLIIFLSLNFFSLKYIKKISIIYYKFSIIYLCLSILFIYLLPFFELSYVLPISFIFIINIAFLIKFYLKSYFLKVLIPTSFIFILIITFFYSGIIRNKEIEVYQNRELTKKIKNFYNKFPTKNNLFFATPDVYYTFELHYWHAGTRVCLVSISEEDCFKERKIKKYSNVIFLFNKGEEILNISEYRNFLINNNFDISKPLQEDFINFYKKQK